MEVKKYAYYLIDGEKFDLDINQNCKTPSQEVLNIIIPKLVKGKNVELVANLDLKPDFLWPEIVEHLNIKGSKDVYFLEECASRNIVNNEVYKEMVAYIAILELREMAINYLKIKELLR